MPISVPAIALFASPPSGACSSSHISGQATSSGFLDYDFNPRPPSSSTSAPSTIQKPIAGGLSCLFSSPPSARHVSAASSPFSSGDELDTLWYDRSEDLSCSYSYKSRTHTPSPISVFHGPVSRSSSSSMRIPPESIVRERSSGGFERICMSSYLDYDVPSLSVPTKEEVGLGEFAFVMEDLVVGSDTSNEAYARDMLSDAQARYKIFTDEFVVKAFYEAEKAHRGQMRASGDPYLQHCVETAVLLADVGANATVVAAGLLHDTLDDCSIDRDYISARFGTSVADLVDGVSKLSHLSKLARENNTADKFAEADRLHTMFLAMADARAVLIKLADRLHNMMTLEALPLIKQMRFAKETLEIFAPLANRLGISSWKEQLENLCFKHLNPEQHMDLSSKVVRSFDESTIASAKRKLEEALDKAGVSYHVICGRHKSLYSIHSKMLKKNLTMDEIHDIHGLRLIVENEYDCYKALDVIHGLWPQVTGRLKDYITHPKFNGYQSLHTVVMSECSVPLEMQIRTKEMHLQAEFGFAAHWRYKEGDCMYSKSVLQMVEWARWVVTWQCLAINDSGSLFSDFDVVRPPCPFPSHLEDSPFSYKPENAHNGPVFVILLENEKMSVQEFPAHSTLMDLFERHVRGSSRWSGYSFPRKEELRPRLNHEPVAPLDRFRKLKMGDVVELTPPIPDKSLSGYRDEIRRMYDSDVAIMQYPLKYPAEVDHD